MTTLSPQLLLDIAQIEANYPERFKAALSGTVGYFAYRMLELLCEDSGYPENTIWSFEGYQAIIKYYNIRRNELDRASD